MAMNSCPVPSALGCPLRASPPRRDERCDERQAGWRCAFSIATPFSLRYDHDPLPSIEWADTVTSISLEYRLL